jgi:hypothetical protein
MIIWFPMKCLKKTNTLQNVQDNKRNELSISYSSDETAHDQTFLVVPIAIFPTP